MVTEMDLCVKCGCTFSSVNDAPPYCWACIKQGFGPHNTGKETGIINADGKTVSSVMVGTLPRPQLNDDLMKAQSITSSESEAHKKLAKRAAEEKAIRDTPGYKNQKVIPRDLCECNNAFKQDGSNWCVNCTLKPTSFLGHPLADRIKFEQDLVSFCLKRFEPSVSIAQLRYFVNQTMKQYDMVHDQ